MERRGGGRRDRRRSRSRSRFEQMHSCLCPLFTFSSIQTYPPSLLHRKSRRRAAAAAPLPLYNVKKKLPDYFSGEGGAGAGTGVAATNLEVRKEEEDVCEEISERGFVTKLRCKCVLSVHQ